MYKIQKQRYKKKQRCKDYRRFDYLSNVLHLKIYSSISSNKTQTQFQITYKGLRFIRIHRLQPTDEFLLAVNCSGGPEHDLKLPILSDFSTASRR